MDKLNIPGWLQLALMLWGGISLFLLAFWNKTRKTAIIGISKTEQEVIKQQLENKLAETKIYDLIELKVKTEIEEFKKIVFDQQQEHYKIKLDMQSRLEREMKARLEVEKERDTLLEQHMNCEEEIKLLKKRVKELETKLS
jgi:hypothetical protein